MKNQKKNRKSKQVEENEEGISQSEDDAVVSEKEYDIETSDDELEERPPKWYDEFPYVKLPKLECSDEQILSLKHEAEIVLSDETTNFKAYLEQSKKSETKWMMTMAKCGTTTDKITALALMIQESPVHNVYALTSLINMAKAAKKHQFMAVIDTLTELFINDLLRPTKKLRKFEKQPLAHLGELCGDDNTLRRKKLCYWLFEDKLKTLFQQFVSLLNIAAQDSVQSNREKAIGAMLKFVLSNREEEDALISNLINKFGDPVHKVASRVVYGLEKVANRHPKMKEAILDEVEKMLFRPHISKRAQYYGICFLSQYRFSSSDSELCKRLIMLYFSFFKACVKTGDIDSRLMGALLVGVNRAYPFAARGVKSETVIPMEHIDTMYKIVHYAPFKIGLQALALLLQISGDDRFYNALYRKLFDKELCQTSHQAIWLNLMMKSIRKDGNENRKKAFVKRILQICLYLPVPLLCGTLVMLSSIIKQLADSDENFTFPVERTEDKPIMPDIVSNLDRFSDENDKHVFDVKSDDDTNRTNATEEDDSKPVGSSWFHRDLLKPSIDVIPKEKKFAPRTAFDSLARNPAYAGGEKAVYVELHTLSKHFHPTVALFSKKILAGERIHYTGDPLKDFTTLHFLDRFSFRNPKKSKTDRGPEKQELFRAVGSERSHYNPKGMRALPVQSDLYLKQQESAVPIDELFLYRYLKGKRSEMESHKEKSKREDDESDLSDVESVGSVEFNDYLDGLMTGKKTAKMLDFAGDIENTKSTKKQGKGEVEEAGEDEDSEDEEDANMENEEADDDHNDDDDELSDDEEDKDSEGSDGAEINEMDLSESEEDEESSRMPLQSALRKRINRDFGSMVMPVEKFSEMLETAGRSKSGSSHTVLDKDNASEKQLRWEASRVKQRWRSKAGPPNKRSNNAGKNSVSPRWNSKNPSNFKRKNNPNQRFNNKKRKNQ